jgi:hypothetical protein
MPTAHYLGNESRPERGIPWSPIQGLQRILSPGVKRQRHEADQSPSSSAKVNEEQLWGSTIPRAVMVWTRTALPLPFTSQQPERSND